MGIASGSAGVEVHPGLLLSRAYLLWHVDLSGTGKSLPKIDLSVFRPCLTTILHVLFITLPELTWRSIQQGLGSRRGLSQGQNKPMP